MTKKADVLMMLYECIDEMNESLPEGQKIERLETAHLYGREGVLDSMSLVHFIALVEERIEEKFDQGLILADEKAFSQKISPFQSVQSMANYINELLQS